MEPTEIFLTGSLSPYFGNDPGPLELSLGQQIRAEVLSRKGDEIILSLMGRRIGTKTDLALQAGDKVKLVVSSLKQDGIVFRIIRDETIPSNDPVESRLSLGRHVETDLARLIISEARQIGLRPSEASTLRIANFIVENPFEENGVGLRLVIIADSLGLPLTQETIDSLEILLFKDFKLSEELSKLITSLTAIAEDENVGGAGQKIWLQNVIQGLKSIPSDISQAQYLKEALGRLGLNFEAQLANTYPGKSSVSSPLKSDLKLLLMSLLEKITTKDEAATSPLRQLAREAAQTLIRGQTAQQLLARSFLISRRPIQDSLIIQVPFRDGEDFRTAFLKISRDAERHPRRIDPNNTTIQLLLETSNLRDVQVQMKISKGKMSGEIAVENEQIRRFLIGGLEELKEGLARTGYDLKGVSTIVRKTLKKIFFEPLIKLSGNLDLKA